MAANTCTVSDAHGRTKETPQYGRNTWYVHDEFNGTVSSPYYKDRRAVPDKHTYTVGSVKPT